MLQARCATMAPTAGLPGGLLQHSLACQQHTYGSLLVLPKLHCLISTSARSTWHRSTLPRCSVVCKQLGLPSNPVRNTTVGGAYYGQGSGGLPIYLHCTGTETSWEQCSTGGLGTRSCECPASVLCRVWPIAGSPGLFRTCRHRQQLVEPLDFARVSAPWFVLQDAPHVCQTRVFTHPLTRPLSCAAAGSHAEDVGVSCGARLDGGFSSRVLRFNPLLNTCPLPAHPACRYGCLCAVPSLQCPFFPYLPACCACPSPRLPGGLLLHLHLPLP